MKKEDRITIFLAPGELFWLAGHLGYKNIPLLGGVFRGKPPEEMRTAIQQGQETLLNRNLVQRRGLQKVEVDPFLISLIGMLALPEYVNLVSSERKDESPINVYMYFKNGQSVSVIFKDRFFHFSLYRETAVLQRSLMSWMGVLGQLSERAVPLRSPTGDITELMRKVWAQPDTTFELLRAAGVEADDATKQADTISQISLVSLLKRINWQTARLSMQGQLTVLGNSANLWYHEAAEIASETPMLQPVSASRAGLILSRFMRADLSEEDQTEAILE